MTGQDKSHAGGSGSDPRRQERRPYQAPALARVNLEAEEVLGVGCKMMTRGHALGATTNCVARGCGTVGS